MFRLADGGSSPAQRDSPKSTEIADWRAEFDGLRWIDDLVKAEGAVDLGGNGYPSWYTAQAKHLLQRFIDGPPYTIKDYDTTTHKMGVAKSHQPHCTGQLPARRVVASRGVGRQLRK